MQSSRNRGVMEDPVAKAGAEQSAQRRRQHNRRMRRGVTSTVIAGATSGMIQGNLKIGRGERWSSGPRDNPRAGDPGARESRGGMPHTAEAGNAQGQALEGNLRRHRMCGLRGGRTGATRGLVPRQRRGRRAGATRQAGNGMTGQAGSGATRGSAGKVSWSAEKWGNPKPRAGQPTVSDAAQADKPPPVETQKEKGGAIRGFAERLERVIQ